MHAPCIRAAQASPTGSLEAALELVPAGPGRQGPGSQGPDSPQKKENLKKNLRMPKKTLENL